MGDLGFVGRLRTRILRLAEQVSWLPMLLARITLFAIFAPTGFGKLAHLDKVTAYFTQLGIPWPHLSAALVGLSEFVCGILLLAGLLSRYASIPLIIDMAIALATAKRDQIHAVSDVFTQEEFVYIVLLVWIAIAGAGPLSIDGLVGRRLKPPRQPVPT